MQQKKIHRKVETSLVTQQILTVKNYSKQDYLELEKHFLKVNLAILSST